MVVCQQSGAARSSRDIGLFLKQEATGSFQELLSFPSQAQRGLAPASSPLNLLVLCCFVRGKGMWGAGSEGGAGQAPQQGEPPFSTPRTSPLRFT